MTRCALVRMFFTCVATIPFWLVPGFGEAPVAVSFQKEVVPFFEEHCIRCHGPEKSKGQISLHTLDGDLSSGRELERWEDVLEMLESGEMPPEDEAQPNQTDRSAIADWIESGLRDYVRKASEAEVATTTRRLTNFEYQNTMRDLLGFELELAKDLPVDPDKPYHFNNTAKMMMVGPDQLVRYKEAARKAMATKTTPAAQPSPRSTTAVTVASSMGPATDSSAAAASWPLNRSSSTPIFRTAAAMRSCSMGCGWELRASLMMSFIMRITPPEFSFLLNSLKAGCVECCCTSTAFS